MRRSHARHMPGIFFLPFPTRACFCPPSPNNLECLLAVSKTHPLPPVYDDGMGGGWKWWEGHFVLLNSHISAYPTCLARKVCGLVRSTWGTSLGEDKLGARDKILNTKVARRACAGQTFPLSDICKCSIMSISDFGIIHQSSSCIKPTP